MDDRFSQDYLTTVCLHSAKRLPTSPFEIYIFHSCLPITLQKGCQLPFVIWNGLAIAYFWSDWTAPMICHHTVTSPTLTTLQNELFKLHIILAKRSFLQKASSSVVACALTCMLEKGRQVKERLSIWKGFVGVFYNYTRTSVHRLKSRLIILSLCFSLVKLKTHNSVQKWRPNTHTNSITARLQCLFQPPGEGQSNYWQSITNYHMQSKRKYHRFHN